MQLTRKALNAAGLDSAAAFAALAVLVLLDTYLRAKTGYGAADLQGVPRPGHPLIANHGRIRRCGAGRFRAGFDYLLCRLRAALYSAPSRRASASRPAARAADHALLAMAPVAGPCSTLARTPCRCHADPRPEPTLASLAAEAPPRNSSASRRLALSLAAVRAVREEERGRDGEVERPLTLRFASVYCALPGVSLRGNHTFSRTR